MWTRAFLLLLMMALGGATGWVVTPAWAEGTIDVVRAGGNRSADNSPENIRKLEVAANQGNAEAQVNLGEAYFSGLGGLSKDDAKAVEWWRKAADQGNAEAQSNLGKAYASGLGGLPKDDAKAVEWWQKAADQGNVEAQGNLGLAYSSGLGGLSKDDATAVRWWWKAADQGNAQAQSNLGIMFHQGRFSPANRQEAQAVEAWYSRDLKNRLSTARQVIVGMLMEEENSDWALPLSPDFDQKDSPFHISNGTTGLVGLVSLVVLAAIFLKADAIDGWVETAWLKLSYLSLPRLGRQECEAFLRFQDRWLGKSLLSWRRWVGATALCVLMIVLTYLLIEGTHFVCRTRIYHPFSVYHWSTQFPFYVIPGAISVSVTRWIINRSLRLLGSGPSSSAAFLGIIVLSSAITSLIAAASTTAMHAIIVNASNVITGGSVGWHAVAQRTLLGAEDVLSQLLDWEWSDTEVFKLSALLHGICSYALPLPVHHDGLTDAQAGLQYAFSVLYGDMQSIGFVAIRIVYAVLFVSWWMLLSAHRGLGAFLLQMTKIKHGATYLMIGIIPTAISIASALKSIYP